MQDQNQDPSTTTVLWFQLAYISPGNVAVDDDDGPAAGRGGVPAAALIVVGEEGEEREVDRLTGRCLYEPRAGGRSHAVFGRRETRQVTGRQDSQTHHRANMDPL